MGTGLMNFYRKNVKKEWKIAFISAVILCFAIHIYKFTNTLPNHDTMYNYYSSQNVIGSGRWFLGVVCGLSSNFNLPWLIGLISAILIALTVVILVDTLKIENPVVIVLAAGITAAFPGITETFFFEYTADGYMVAMLFAALAVRLSVMDKRKWYNIAVPAVLICLCCAIYQAYVSYALVAAACYLILELFNGERETGDYVKWIIKQTAIYVIGLALYYVIWKILLRIEGAAVNNYQGISDISFSFSTIITGFKSTVISLLFYIFEWNPIEHGLTVFACFNVIFMVFLAVAVIGAVVKTKIYKRPALLIMLILCCLSIPFFACIWHFASDGVGYRPMMLLSLSIIYILAAVLFERFFSVKLKNAVAVFLAAMIFNNAVIANIAYYYMDRTYMASFSTASEMISRIHQLDTDSTQIKVIGEITSAVSLELEENAEKIHMFSHLLESNLLFDEYYIVKFLNETFYCEYSWVGDDWKYENGRELIIDNMGCWPASDSIQVIDGVIVIKLADEEDSD